MRAAVADPSGKESLWEYVKAGQVTTIGSDHSPSPTEMKKDKNFFKVWGGISAGNTLYRC